jgi:hypothetical protein
LTEGTDPSLKVHLGRAGLPAISPAALHDSCKRFSSQGSSAKTARLSSTHSHPQRLFRCDFLALLEFLRHGIAPSINGAPLGHHGVICKLPSNVHDELGGVQVASFVTESIKNCLLAALAGIGEYVNNPGMLKSSMRLTNCICGRGNSAGSGPRSRGAPLPISLVWPAPVHPAPIASQMPRFPYLD